jgi:[acyl-carrier-protein] S-malonyltransferase
MHLCRNLSRSALTVTNRNIRTGSVQAVGTTRVPKLWKPRKSNVSNGLRTSLVLEFRPSRMAPTEDRWHHAPMRYTSSKTKLAYLFPGQGSQYAGMGKGAAGVYPEACRVFELADSALGFAISSLCFEGPEDDLKLTENTQPAILTTSVALHRVLLDATGETPDFVAGHSLGEYSALVAAGALSLSDAVVLVGRRGQYMQEAVPVGVGTMAAIFGLSSGDVAAVCREASRDEIVELANLNGAGQVVIAGNREAVDRACEIAKTRGARRAIPLPVSAPFHCKLMEPAAARLAPDLDKTGFSNPVIPLFTNVDAKPITSGREAREALKRQVVSPVRWEETIEAMASAGVRRFVEIGPGRVLAGLVRKIAREADVSSIAEPADLEKYLADVNLV